jgi:hypothetical protein
MAEKPGYWDLHRCAWVDVETSPDFAPVPSPAADVESTPIVAATVPEQRPDIDASLVTGTPD